MSEERLDAQTEQVLSALIYAGYLHCKRHKGNISACEPCQRDLSFVRDRISILVYEAREKAVVDADVTPEVPLSPVRSFRVSPSGRDK